MSKPIRLKPSFREKVWGSAQLAPWFPNPEKKIGEVWLTSESDPVLIKFLFTSEKLSVQVHPDDSYAWVHENSPGKTEMWYILRAEEGARIALGFAEPITRERLRESALSGEIEQLLRWIPVRPGETYFTPARTVHAIGAGIALLEIQQNSDITYRLYDYGRPRELHLERSVDVADLGHHCGASAPLAISEERTLLARCEYFITELLELKQPMDYAPDAGQPHFLVCLEGHGVIADSPFGPGDAFRVPAGGQPFEIKPETHARLIRAYVPS